MAAILDFTLMVRNQHAVEPHTPGGYLSSLKVICLILW